MITTIILTILATIALGTALLFVLQKPIVHYITTLATDVMQQRLQSVLDEKMKQGAQTLDSKKDAIKELVDRIGHDLEASQKKIEQSEQARISQFSALKSVVDEHKLVTSELKTSTDDLKNILSNNQLRGRYGEEVAENLLLSVGFVKGQQYLANTALDTVTTRPDFTILLPDKTKLNIDAKFPFQSLLKYQAAETKVDKDIYLREFSKDVKQKIKQATSRDYINPAEQTLDFVVMFVPNEMIFSFIYEKMPDIWEDALKQKVILAGPFSFTALLRMVYQAYRNFRYQENLHDIIKLIKTFELEYTKFNEELDTLGTRLQSASDQYQKVSVTRTKKLTSVVEKIKTEEISDATDEVVELIK